MDRTTIDKIYRENADEFARHADRWLADADEARDVVQDAFLKLWQQKEEPVKPRGSLFVTVRNICFDRLRRRSVRPTVALTEVTDGSVDERVVDTSDTSEADSHEQFLSVEQIINRELSARDREILLLHDYNGWDYDEISRKTGMEPAALRMVVSRARKTVRQCYLKQQSK